MSARTLMILNAIGCLLLTLVVVGQWMHERTLKLQADRLQREIGGMQLQVEEQIEKRKGMERDVGMLKDSLDQARKAIDDKQAAVEEREAVITGLKQEIVLAQKQLEVWNKAVEERDRRIQSLDADLLETRRRLDQAIGQLKSQRTR